VSASVGGDRVPLFAEPDREADPIGERKVGDVLRLVRREDGFALLHPLELSRVAVDYQDYWSAILKNEVPRPREDAWIPLSCLAPLQPGESPDAFGHWNGADVQPDAAEEPWLSMGEDGALGLVAETLTVIVSTSPAEHHCDVGLMLQVLRSLQANAALRECRKLVVFDALPGESVQQAAEDEGAVAESGKRWVPRGNDKLAQAYERYKCSLQKALEEEDYAMHRVELLFMPHWGHLVGTVRYAMDRLSTPYVLLHQHDLLLNGSFSSSHVVGILRALARREANYVIMNRDINFVGRSTQYFQAAPHRPDLWRVFQREHALRLEDGERTPLTPFVGFSDQTHVARASWVKDRVLRMVGDRKCCMEFAVHEFMLLAWLHDPSRWEKTYMLGGMDDGPFVHDSQKNGYCWAAAEDAYSDEKLEDVLIRTEDCVQHPQRPGMCLSLYIFRPGDGFRPGSIFHYPDTDMESNRLSRELFDLDGRLQSRDRKKHVFVHRWAPD